MFTNIDWFDFIVGGVIVSLIVNLLSSYLYPKIENFLAKFSAKRKKEKETREQKILEEAQRLLDNPHEELVFKQYYYNLLNHRRNWFIITTIILILASSGDNVLMLIMGLVYLVVEILDKTTKEISTLHSIVKNLNSQKERPSYDKM